MQNKQGFSVFRGNIAALAISGSIKSLGNIIGSFVPLYFVQIIGGNSLTLGLFASVAALFQFFTVPIGGFLADYYGRRRIMVFAAFYAVFFPLFYAVVSDWRVFGLLTVAATFGAIANPAYHAMVVDSIPHDKRTSAIAYIQVVSSLPLTIAPLIGGWLMENYGLESGFKLACIYATAFSFISAIVTFILLKETLQPFLVKKPNFSVRNSFAGLTKLAYTLPASLKALMVAYALVAFANGAVGQFYVLYAYDVIKLGEFEWGLVVSAQSFVACVLRIPGGWLSDRFGKRKVLMVSLLACAPTAIIFTLSQSLIQVMVTALLLVVTGIYYAPAHEALQADLTPKAMRGRITALWDISSAVSAALGALVGGIMFQSISPAAPFYIFTVVESVALVLIIGMVKEPTTKED